MAKITRRTPEQRAQLIAAYEQSGLSKQEFCERQNLRLTSLEYYRQRVREQRGAGQFLKVELAESQPKQLDGLSLLLANQRRIEMSWNFSEQQLAKLIRIVETA
jgi:transposase-like protein